MKNYVNMKLLCVLLICPVILSCQSNRKYDAEDGLSSFSEPGIEQHIRTLSSDEFQGRRPFTAGEEKSLAYLQDEFKKMGLEPGNAGSFLQEVPMVEITPAVDSVMFVKGGGKDVKLSGFSEYTLTTERTDSVINWKNEDVVFAGFGIVAPEYNWNDYEGLDVKGKIVLVLVNDPGFGGADSTFFKGNTMTYYGRWTYKFEEAARQGAKGCFVIHNTVPAGYGFWVLQTGWNSPHLYLDQRAKSKYYCEGVGWLSMPATEKLFAAAGMDFSELQSKARQPGFKGISLGVNVSTSMKVKTSYGKTFNVLAKITGATRPDEYIVYTAHWDHLGTGKPDASGDSIYNGAVDNGGGVAMLLEIGKAFTSLKNKPDRTVVFLAVTAEEQGLWGSAYYAQNPVYPLDKTVANINMDFTNTSGKMKDLTVTGMGQSELEDILREEASKFGRYLAREPHPEAGYYFRSDHFNFARVGVPALAVSKGIDHAVKGKEFGEAADDDYRKNRYHQPGDEYDPDSWDLSGIVDDAKLLFQTGKRLAFDSNWPKWKDGSEFKAIREKKP